MKKSKILILSAITPLSVILSTTTITACSKDPEIKNEFVCEQPEQSTIRGESACWYFFEYSGSENIPNDIKVEFATQPKVLNDYVLVQIIGDKKLQVGVQGIRDQLRDSEPVNFTLKFNSEKLGLVDQLINCKYTYLEIKIKPLSPKVEERQATELASGFSVDASFELTNTPFDINKLDFEFTHIKKSDEAIQDPKCNDGFQDVERNIHGQITVQKNGTWNEGDWIKFDIHFTYDNGAWEQTVTDFTYQALDIQYLEDSINKTCDIQIDIKGTTQAGLKAYNEEQQKGFLPKGTPIYTPFALKFHKDDSPEEWSKEPNLKFYKFGSFVNPEKYSSGYYHYFSVVVKVVKPNDQEEVLEQTYTGDSEGTFGYWWISTGGPITVIKKKLDEQFPGWKDLIFELRTAQEIEHDSSFYLTYGVK